MIRDDGDRLQTAFRTDVSKTSGTCPTADELWAALRGECAAEEINAIVAHTAVCGACAEDWRISAAMLSASEENQPSDLTEKEEQRGAKILPFPARWGVVLAVAAALLFFIIPSDPPVPPPANGPSILRGTSYPMESHIQGQELDRQNATLQWQAFGEGVNHYDLRVTTQDLFQIVVDLQGLSQTAYTIPAQDLADLPNGSQLFWQVTAQLEDGSSEASLTHTNLLADQQSL